MTIIISIAVLVLISAQLAEWPSGNYGYGEKGNYSVARECRPGQNRTQDEDNKHLLVTLEQCSGHQEHFGQLHWTEF